MSKIKFIKNIYKVESEGHTSDWKCDCKPVATRDGGYVTVFHK